MKKEIFEGIPRKEKSRQAVDIIKIHLAEYFQENLWTVVSVCMDNEDWSERLVKASQVELLHSNDIVHDIRGLREMDEHFVPRI